MTGPPKSPEDDEKAVRHLMEGEAYRIVSGGTSSEITARILDKPITAEPGPLDPNIPPIAHIEGIDLTTEGVITLSHTLKLLEKYASDEDLDESFYNQLDENNGGAMIAKILIEDCTDMEIILGTAVNAAHLNPNLAFHLHARNQLAEHLKELMEQMNKTVTITYY